MRFSALSEVDLRGIVSRRRWWIAGGLIVVLSLVGVWRAQALSQRPTVRVMFNRFPPYLDKGPDGTPVGFAVEMFTEAARRAKVGIRWVEFEESADKAFSEGKADMYPLMTITPERESRFYMSAPWWENQFALISTEGREIPDAAAAKGKVIATRIGVIQALSQRLYPGAHFVNMLTLQEMERALCERRIDGFFSDMKLLQTQLLQRTTGCADQALHVTSMPGSKLYLGTASTRDAASVNDRIFREIAELALDGTLSRTASNWGIFTPYDTARLKQVVDAEARERLMAWVLLVTLLILTLSVIQTNLVRRAKQDAESAQTEAKEMHDRFDEFMKNTPAITFIKDARGRVVYSNEEFCGHRERSAASGRSGSDNGQVGTISPQLCYRDVEVLEFGRRVEVTERLHGQDGINRHFLVLKFPFRTSAGVRFLGGVALDVTARIVAEKELEHHAKNDLLTGLPNRRNFMTELGQALQRSCQRGQQLAVGFIDLDGFKRVNDRLGHEAGDELLRQVAGRLKQVCRESDMVARLGGDEFTFLLRGVSGVGARQVMTEVLNQLEESFPIGGSAVSITASIGLSLFPEDGINSQQLLRNADSAMYCAKQNGKGRIEFWSTVQSDRQPVGARSP